MQLIGQKGAVDASGHTLIADANYTGDGSAVEFQNTYKYGGWDQINADNLEVKLNTTGSGSGIEVLGLYNNNNGVVLNTNVNINAT